MACKVCKSVFSYLLICDFKNMITFWTFARGSPSTVQKCPWSYCKEFVFGGLDENFKGASEKPAVADSPDPVFKRAQQPCMMRTGCCGNQKKSTSPRRFFCQMAALSSR